MIKHRVNNLHVLFHQGFVNLNFFYSPLVTLYRLLHAEEFQTKLNTHLTLENQITATEI